MKTTIQNIRTKVDKRQIIQYLLLRHRIMVNKATHPTNESYSSIKSCKIRAKELNLLIKSIKQDTIDKEIRNMHQYIHRQNDYQRKLINKSKEEQEQSNG